ncbi:hypothetical protein [Paraburkholderia sp. J7]|uniref:hypothetical protein n=1 Tax=Paraburkholderia sp. J7 TaxID=2805438 RepID=UPI002AB5EC3F|nr:hypothetical protein [Paraburkholderia sp. J7]
MALRTAGASHARVMPDAGPLVTSQIGGVQQFVVLDIGQAQPFHNGIGLIQNDCKFQFIFIQITQILISSARRKTPVCIFRNLNCVEFRSIN